jgi:hypothetical protein
MRKSGLIHGHLVAEETLYFLTSKTGTDKPYLMLEQKMFLPTYAEHDFENAKYPKTKPTYADATKLYRYCSMSCLRRNLETQDTINAHINTDMQATG